MAQLLTDLASTFVFIFHLYTYGEVVSSFQQDYLLKVTESSNCSFYMYHDILTMLDWFS